MKALPELGMGASAQADRRECARGWPEAGSAPSVAMLRLTSGERVRIEAGTSLAHGLVTAFSGSSVAWLRVGFGRVVDEQLRREARQAPPDLLLLGGVGDWPLAVGRARTDYDGVPILAVAESARQVELLALRAGADAFCGLPVDAELFEARARALLRRASNKPLSALAEAPTLDEASRTLHFAGVSVQLSVAELALVKLLHRHKECWVSSQLLWQALGRDPSGYDASLLRTHAMNVRKKLGAQRWLLQSERGKGMMLTTSPTYRALSRTS
jgi:DNA-binding response OmpR family regulator